MTHARWPSKTNLYLFRQNNGWVFILGNNLYDDPIKSGKRKTLEGAILAAKPFVPEGSSLVYSMIESTKNDWVSI
jgi:hypothetical protein